MIESHESKWLIACEMLAPLFSKCAKRQYFCVIIGKNKRLFAQGYNGAPPGHDHCDDGACPRLHLSSEPGSSYGNCIAQHAEAGALLWSNRTEREGATLIVNGPPCFDCSKLIASSGISKVICFYDETYKDWPRCLDMMMKSNIEVIAMRKKDVII
jgi:dCMP deaminase